MASVALHGKTYRARFIGADGKEQRRPTPFVKGQKKEALAYARELEALFLRARSGVGPAPMDPTRTFGWLYQWWWERYGSKRRGRSKGDWDKMFRARVLKQLGEVKLPDLTPLVIEAALKSNEGPLGPKTLNELRGTIFTVIERASIRGGPWTGPNPVKEVSRWKAGKKVKDTLRPDEVPLLLENLSERWVPLFATAIWTGMRKGELAGLKRTSVNLRHPGEETLVVRASWEADRTKNEDQDVLPVPAPLVPYLKQALASTASELLFPGPTGEMMTEDTKLEMTLRRALARAGLVAGWLHTCRRCKSHGTPHEERHEDDKVRKCPSCSMRLWPKPVYRPITFHGLRSSTGTLLAKAGVPTAIAQKILRHSDIKMTADIYTQVDLGDMRSAMDRLLPANVIDDLPPTPTQNEEAAMAANGDARGPQGTDAVVPLASQGTENPKAKGLETVDFSSDSEALLSRGDRIRTCDPLVPKSSTGDGSGGYAGGTGTQPVAIIRRGRETVPRQGSRFPADFGKNVPLASHRNQVPSGPTLVRLRALPTALLSVRDVAATLGVSTATVYALVEAGSLAHVRVSNAIRIERAALDSYLATQRGGNP